MLYPRISSSALLPHGDIALRVDDEQSHGHACYDAVYDQRVQLFHPGSFLIFCHIIAAPDQRVNQDALFLRAPRTPKFLVCNTLIFIR